MLVSTVTGCMSISAFASLVDIPVRITSSSAPTKICVITAGVEKHKSIIKKKKKEEHDKTMLLGKAKLNRPGRFPGIVGNAGNHGNDRKYHKSHQMLNQTKRNINELCSEKNLTSRHSKNKIFRGFRFSNMLYDKKENPEKPRINRKLAKSKSNQC